METMAGGETEEGEAGATYSLLLGFVFIFNLIVGAGALAIPAVFSKTGLWAASAGLCLLAFTSYVTVTFVVEAMAGVNAILDSERACPRVTQEALGGYPSITEMGNLEERPADDTDALLEEEEDSESKPEKALRFHLDRKVELGLMAQVLFGSSGVTALYVCLVVYLYGDLAIYAVAVPKSLRELTCPPPDHLPAAHRLPWPCVGSLDSTEVYRLYVVLFGAVLGGLALGDVHKTRHVQLLTTLVRHAAFLSMVVIAVVGVARGEGVGWKQVAARFEPQALPEFFGVCVYSFMCHHSLPGLVAPIVDKRPASLAAMLAAAYAVVVGVYLALCVSALLRFPAAHVQDVYSLNFEELRVPALPTLLALFPVFTLSTNFPLIAITLRENLRTLASSSAAPAASGAGGRVWGVTEQQAFGVLAVGPPLAVALATEDVGMLVGYTGSYAGIAIQSLLPASFVLALRRRLRLRPPPRGPAAARGGGENPFGSPLRSDAWAYAILAWAALALLLITVSHLHAIKL